MAREVLPDLAFLMWTRNDLNLGGLYVSYLATRRRIDELMETDWFDESLGYRENERRMKEVGGAGLKYLVFLKTSSVLSLAKATEDLYFILREEANWTPGFWASVDQFEFALVAKEVRALSNVIKHSLSYVDSSRSRSAAYLVKDLGYRDRALLDIPMMHDQGAFDIPSTVERMYCFLSSVVEVRTGMRHAFLDLPPSQRNESIRLSLVPAVLRL